MQSTLSNKIDQAKMVIEEAFDNYPAAETIVAWSAGKDSTLMLRLILDVCKVRGIDPPLALDIDQRDQFDELTALRERLATEWDLQVLIVRNDDFLNKVERFGDSIQVDALNKPNRNVLKDLGYDKSTVTWEPDSPACNQLLKTAPVNEAIVHHGIKSMFTGIRWDEHGARQSETFFSPRNKPPHMRIHPILHFSERDVWDATFALHIPYSELYIQGYRSIGSKSGTLKPASAPAWEQDLEQTTERGGRSEDKEAIMEQLRALGYM